MAWPSSDGGGWFRQLTPGRGTAAIVVFPPAGSGAALFGGWRDLVPPDVEVLVMTMPGRENRLAERPLWHVGPILEAVARQLGPIRMPMVLFGHSAGAYLASLAVAQVRPELVRSVVVAASPSPDWGTPNMSLATDAELLAAMRAWGGTPEQLFHQPDLLELFLPCLRADLAVAHQCRSRVLRHPVDVPILALHGESDRSVTLDQMATWQRWTERKFTLRQTAGGHFFPVTLATEVVPALVELLM